MDIHTEKMHIGDLPSTTRDSAFDHIAQFTVGLYRICRDKNREALQLIGTGTLVLVGGLYCILTAAHVLAKIRDTDQLGLMYSFSGELPRHTFEYDRSHLHIHTIAKGEDDSKGPDIGLVLLPQANIGFLKDEKVFFNIDSRRERFSERFLEKDRGFWLTCGFEGESETDLGPRGRFSAIKGYSAHCGASVNPTEREDSDFDYLEVKVDYSTGNPELPSSFGGFSGGGLWQVPLEKNQGGEITPKEYVLSGVVFYQTAVEENLRRLRCHGRKTVYVKVPEFVSRIKSS